MPEQVHRAATQQPAQAAQAQQAVPQPVRMLLVVLQQVVLAALALRVAQLTAVSQQAVSAGLQVLVELAVTQPAHQAATLQAVLAVQAGVPAARLPNQEATNR